MARQASTSAWEVFDDHSARMVAKGSSRQAGVPVAGTPIVTLAVDARRERVMIDVGTQTAEKGVLRGSALTVQRRVALAQGMAEILQLDPVPESQAPQPELTLQLPSLQTKRGSCDARGLPAAIAQCGFLDASPLQIVVVHAANESALGQKMARTLTKAISASGPLGEGLGVYRTVLSAEQAHNLLSKKPLGQTAKNREKTVLIFALPEGSVLLDETSPQLSDLDMLRCFGVPIVAARPVTHKTGAGNSLLYKIRLARQQLPYRVKHDFGVDALVGLDAAHDHGSEGDSRWAAVLLGTNGEILGGHALSGGRDESFKRGVAGQVLNSALALAKAKGFSRLLVHRDGRPHATDGAAFTRLAEDLGLPLEYVPVSKFPRVVLFREEQGQVAPPQFGDALVERDGSAAWAFTAHGSRAEFNNPVCIWGLRNVAMAKALSDLFAAALLPTLGLFQSTRLPATTYWADLLSKRDVAQSLARSGFLDFKPQSTTRGTPPPAP